MSVAAIQEYAFPAQDTADKFPVPLLYIGWDQHMLFCAPFCLPLPPQMPFGALIENVLPSLYSVHPDFAHIDWAQVQWLKGGQPWQPDPAKSLAENGLKHKDAIRFRTPGLNGIQGSAH